MSPQTTLPPKLTTTFTPAPSCLTEIHEVLDTDKFDVSKTTSHFWIGPSRLSDVLACLPSGWDLATTAYFSPSVCPSEYYTACSTTVNIDPLEETRATCCPRYAPLALLIGLLFANHVDAPVTTAVRPNLPIPGAGLCPVFLTRTW